ncbi:hypothetical protein ZIOFF_022047 [Zingiber officinale]|uniref:DUF4219 domain-containing protein n=1 Tax=Zingiber officinale TaxID=94328 RepID=A0A8J5LGY2_ZINOF|nr:hypothetical protein ZIOFF_022047 [Zingiber officinale]
MFLASHGFLLLLCVLLKKLLLEGARAFIPRYVLEPHQVLCSNQPETQIPDLFLSSSYSEHYRLDCPNLLASHTSRAVGRNINGFPITGSIEYPVFLCPLLPTALSETTQGRKPAIGYAFASKGITSLLASEDVEPEPTMAALKFILTSYCSDTMEMIEVNGCLKLDSDYSGVHVQLSGNCREWRKERTCEGGGDLSADVFVNILEQNWNANLKIISLFALLFEQILELPLTWSKGRATGEKVALQKLVSVEGFVVLCLASVVVSEIDAGLFPQCENRQVVVSVLQKEMEACGSGFSSTTPPVFDGENYQVWAVKMSAFMEGSDLWEVVKDDYEVTPLHDNPTINQIQFHKESITRKAKAKAKAESCLYATVSPFIFNRIMKFPTAKDIWNFLKIEYEDDEKIRGMKALNLMREFKRQQMKENEVVKDFSDRLINLANRIRVLGTDMKDDRIVQKILVSLLERFEATIASLENTKDMSDIRLAELLSALEAQEQRRLMRREVPVEALEGALPARSQMRASGREKKSWNQRKGNAKGSSNNKGHAEQRHPSESGSAYQRERFDSCKHCGGTNHPHYKCWRRLDVKCNNCLGFGHIARFCQEKDSLQDATKGAANNEVVLMFTASCFATGVAHRSWLVEWNSEEQDAEGPEMPVLVERNSEEQNAEG